MRSIGLCAAGILCAGAPDASAQQVTPIGELRLRWEQVGQDGLPERSDAITARLHAGAAVTHGPWSALVEGEATLPIAGAYNDGLNGRAERPLIVDPGNLQLNRAQLGYGAGDWSVTAGRQHIALLDQRFVGSAPFRQNDQSFDAVRVRYGKPAGLALDVSYAWQALGVNGARGRGSRPDAIGGGNLFAVAAVPTPIGTANGFAFIVDQDESAVQGFQLSSQSYGLRLSGDRALGSGTVLTYAASWAVQRDHGRNPNRYRAQYALGEATLGKGGVTATLGYEVLGADRGAPLTSFQTPLSSLFKFQGWADKFTTTPPDGVRDLYGGAGFARKRVGGFDAISLSASYHRFRADRIDRFYGDEIDLLASVTRGRTTLSARYAHYRAEGFATDTDKLWLQADWVL